MRKRLRKKKHLGEFKVYGIPVYIKRNAEEKNIDKFLDDFIDVIEKNKCFCAGHGDKNKYEMFIELGRKDVMEEALENITSYLNDQSDIEEYSFGEITDAHYGPFE